MSEPTRAHVAPADVETVRMHLLTHAPVSSFTWTPIDILDEAKGSMFAVPDDSGPFGTPTWLHPAMTLLPHPIDPRPIDDAIARLFPHLEVAGVTAFELYRQHAAYHASAEVQAEAVRRAAA